MDATGIEVPEPPRADMSAEGFARDQDIIDASCSDDEISRTFAIGRSEEEMVSHFFAIAAKANRDKESRLNHGDAP